MDDVKRGTFECPICGFDRPHPHTPQIVEWHRTGNRISPKGSGIADEDGNDAEFEWGPLNNAQRKRLRDEAEAYWKRSQLKKEFEAGPRAYVDKYGTINSSESTWLVSWLLDRNDRLDKVLRSIAEGTHETTQHCPVCIAKAALATDSRGGDDNG